MTAMYDFDAVLASALQADGPQADATDGRGDGPAARRGPSDSGGRSCGPWTRGRGRRRASRRRTRTSPGSSPSDWSCCSILGLVAAFVAAGRLLERRTNVFGVFERTGDFPAVPAELGEAPGTSTRRQSSPTVVSWCAGCTRAVNADAWALVYDPAAGTWSETGREPEYRQESTATTLRDGRVLIVGGWRMDTEGTQVLPSVAELYDPATGLFQPTNGGLATPRHDHTATAADGWSGADRRRVGRRRRRDPGRDRVGRDLRSRDRHLQPGGFDDGAQADARRGPARRRTRPDHRRDDT